MNALPMECNRWRFPLPLVLMLLVGFVSAAAAAPKASRSKTVVATLPKVRLVAISTPVAVSKVLKATRPIKLGSVSYLNGDYRTSYDVMAAGTRTGSIAWEARRQEQKQTPFSGVIAASKVRRMAGGSVCIVVQGNKSAPLAKGEQRFGLFSQFSREYQATMVFTPEPLPAEARRTALMITGNTEVAETTKPKSPGAPGAAGGRVKWLNGSKGHDTAMKELAATKKGVMLYFSEPTSARCRSLEAEVFSACRAGEVLARATAVKIVPSRSAAEKKLAGRYGVTAFPSLLVVTAQSNKPTWVLPENKRDSQPPAPAKGKGGGGVMPCHVTDVIAAALQMK